MEDYDYLYALDTNYWTHKSIHPYTKVYLEFFDIFLENNFKNDFFDFSFKYGWKNEKIKYVSINGNFIYSTSPIVGVGLRDNIFSINEDKPGISFVTQVKAPYIGFSINNLKLFKNLTLDTGINFSNYVDLQWKDTHHQRNPSFIVKTNFGKTNMYEGDAKINYKIKNNHIISIEGKYTFYDEIKGQDTIFYSDGTETIVNFGIENKNYFYGINYTYLF